MATIIKAASSHEIGSINFKWQDDCKQGILFMNSWWATTQQMSMWRHGWPIRLVSMPCSFPVKQTEDYHTSVDDFTIYKLFSQLGEQQCTCSKPAPSVQGIQQYLMHLQHLATNRHYNGLAHSWRLSTAVTVCKKMALRRQPHNKGVFIVELSHLNNITTVDTVGENQAF
jgi:hypothetical protein